MSSPVSRPLIVRFGPFELDLGNQELRKAGVLLKLQAQPYRVLAALAKRAGQVVSREELRQELWGQKVYVDFEQGLNYCISEIRAALGDDAQSPRYIQTLPKRGYRFVAEVAEGRVGSEGKTADPPPVAAVWPLRQRRLGTTLAVGSAAVVIIAAALVVKGRRPALIAQPIHIEQLTHYGGAEVQTKVVTDGRRLYFVQRSGGQWSLAQVAIEGGTPVPVPTPFQNTEVFDISPNGSNLLVGAFPHPTGEDALWVVPLPSGSPRRLGDLAAHDAIWTPDGNEIAFAHREAIYIAQSDGGGARKIVSLTGSAEFLAWSPDARRRLLRFTLEDPVMHYTSLWEMTADGNRLQPLLRNWTHQGFGVATGESCGIWTPDGKYFLFHSARIGRVGLWGIQEEGGWLGLNNNKPAELYTTPGWISPAAFGKDGRRMFFVGGSERRSLVSYNLKTRRLNPYLTTESVQFVSFSPDGRRLAYSSRLDGTLWVSRPDGREAVQLTFPPLLVTQGAAWSPDGRYLFFAARLSTGQSKIFKIPAGGGTAQRVTPVGFNESDPNWSPDGKAILCARAPETEGSPSPSRAIYVWDLSATKADRIPGSEGLDSPRWSPNGRYLAAVSQNGNRIMLFDFRGRRWSALADAGYLNGPYWSRDSKYLYFQDFYHGSDEPTFRVDIAARRTETAISYRMIPNADVISYSLVGVTLDGSPLLALTHKTGDLYTLELNLP